MTANTSRNHPAEGDGSAELLSATARDLPPGRHQFHKERLMAQIHDMRQAERTATPAPEPRRRFPRPAVVLPLTAAALATAVVAGVVLSGNGGNGVQDAGPALTTTIGAASSKGVPQLLDQISLAAAATSTSRPAVEPGQYIYIKSKMADSYISHVGDKTSLAGHPLHTRQTWMSADGTKGWLIDPAVNQSPEGETLSLPDEQGNTRKPTLNGPSYDYLTKLTTDPDKLLAKIYRETKGQGNSPDQEAFTTIGDLLGESYPPAALYPALFKAAAKIPGVVVVDDATDATGRHGVAVARLDEASGEREEWIFDRKSHVFLGERSVQVRRNSGTDALITPGTVVFTSAILERTVVDAIRQTPATTS
ncbi:CU044_5270 family protein [Streptomyces humi]|uniref:CU044_5270 family protein n=1 Tax=Streptomyces humi TaxID=1428620 RepID=UPI0006288D65|nr:CU044_5270 family protein [Streptomyces humi]